MIIVDTSVWIEHIRVSNETLLTALSKGLVLHHPFVTAELALGSIPDREVFCAMLGKLPAVEPMENSQFLEFVSSQELYGTGVGMVDAHLLASAANRKGTVWAFDKRLSAQAERLGIAYNLK
jgi:predicted nucleic acid-binding protein